MKSIRILAIATALGALATAQAAQQTYTFSGTITGSLGGTNFSAKEFSIVGIGDSSTIESRSFGWINTLSSNTLTVTGFAPVSIANLGVFMNNDVDVVGAWRTGTENLDVYNVTIGEDHDLTGPFGPKSGAAFANPGSPFATSGGEFVIDRFDSPGTYSVNAVVPEPATFTALGIGALMLRRRRTSA